MSLLGYYHTTLRLLLQVRKGGLWTLLLIWGAYKLPAQPLAFDFLSVSDGLTAEVVTCVYRDSRGLVWIGTQNGLQTYNGYTLATHDINLTAPGKLRSAGIRNIAEDKNGDLWISTHEAGLSRYLRKQDRFETYRPSDVADGFFPAKNTKQILRGPQGNLWITSADGLFRLNDPSLSAGDTPVFVPVKLIPNDTATSLNQAPCQEVGFDREGNLYAVFKKQGLGYLAASRLSEVTDTLTLNLYRFEDLGIPANILSLTAGPDGSLWIGHSLGLCHFKRGTSQGEYPLFPWWQERGFTVGDFYDQSDFASHLQYGHRITQCLFDQQQRLWLLCPHGVYTFEPANRGFTFYSLKELGIPQKGFNVAVRLYLDDKGLFWLPTMEGVGIPTARQLAFRRLGHHTSNAPTMVRAMLRDSSDQLWMGVENGGLFLFDAEADSPYLHLQLSTQERNRDFIMTLREADRNRLLVGTYGGGLVEIALQRNTRGRVIDYTITQYLAKASARSQPEWYVYDVCRDPTGNFWVAGFSHLTQISPQGQVLKQCAAKVANGLLQTDDGTLWVGTDEGLFVWDHAGDTLQAWQNQDSSLTLAGYRIETLVEDQAGILWIGTNRGLLALDRKKSSIQHYGTASGLMDQQIRGITLDQRGQLWVMTLTALHKRVGRGFVAYQREQGLWNEMFIARAMHHDQQGRIYAGGDKGIVWFHPDSLKSTEVPDLCLSSLSIFQEKAQPGQVTQSGFMLPATLNELESLTLTHRERMISFEFAGLGYQTPSLYRYAYFLEGFDPEWQEVPAHRRRATYTNLPAGNYTLRVRVAAGANDWQASRSLNISVLPPWWQTWWAYLGYVLLGIGAIYGIIRQRTKTLRREMVVQQRLNQAREEEREKVRAESARDFHDQAGSQLSRLSLYHALLRRGGPQVNQEEMFDKAESSIRALAESMKDFVWILDQRDDQLEDLLLRVKGSGEALFEHSPIEFVFLFAKPRETPPPLSPNIKRHLLLLCKEAFNNALKYSQANEVRFRANWDAEHGTLSLQIVDNGIGFHTDHLSRVNGLNNMKVRAEEIGATFELNSMPSLGTHISLRLPITPNGG